jgi:sialic acid synthase SpsE
MRLSRRSGGVRPAPAHLNERVQIGSFDLATQVLVVAEIGNNHEGQFDVAERMVRAAAEAGADAVKFQTFRTDHYVSRSDEARYQRLKRFELAPSQFESLAQLARSLGVLFMSTPFDVRSADVLEPLVDAYKIASGDNTFYPLLDRVAATRKPVIVSTGLSDLDVIDRAVARVHAAWDRVNHRGELAILHCVTAYPTPPAEANLAAIDVLASRYGCTVGYSDHTIGIDATIVAVARGARIVEKHFTLDKNYSAFRDHQLSADPDDFRTLVTRVRATTTALGSPEKRVQSCEAAVVTALRRSIVAAAPLDAGHVLQWSDLTWIRPGGGLPPGDEHVLVGKPLLRTVAFGELLLPSDVGKPVG